MRISDRTTPDQSSALRRYASSVSTFETYRTKVGDQAGALFYRLQSKWQEPLLHVRALVDPQVKTRTAELRTILADLGADFRLNPSEAPPAARATPPEQRAKLDRWLAENSDFLTSLLSGKGAAALSCLQHDALVPFEWSYDALMGAERAVARAFDK
jgi:hypothetical protein